MKTRGFTLVELITILIIVGVLAVAAIPRFLDKQTFDERGFYDETLAALRYAQKQAIAQRRTVCVAFASSPGPTVTLTMVSAYGSSNCVTSGGTAPMASPTGVSPFVVPSRAGLSVSFSGTPTSFSFNPLGQPQTFATIAAPLASTLTITVSGVPGNIKVERETGHVH